MNATKCFKGLTQNAAASLALKVAVVLDFTVSQKPTSYAHPQDGKLENSESKKQTELVSSWSRGGLWLVTLQSQNIFLKTEHYFTVHFEN